MSFSKPLSYGSVAVQFDEALGIGSYGKVCKAKFGQLPCAAKLLHDTMFGNNDPGIRRFAQRFEEEGKFLKMLKHPNIVQFLGTSTDPQSGRLCLLMELMDENLTKFLERSTGPLPYHTQVNICHDVALALAYLHSNSIIHRDLSSNNVLLIGEGSRAKVTDFGMSKLTDMNPRMTPLTTCPGTAAYMPPEALLTPPRYSNKLDCFSHGVLVIQVTTRNFPEPENPHPPQYIDSPHVAGRYVYQLPEYERRKKDIKSIDPKHPLLPTALRCIKDRDFERPSADEVCSALAKLKRQPNYLHSTRQTWDQAKSVRELTATVQRLQLEIKREKDSKEEYRREVMELRGFNTYLFDECHAKSQENEKYEREATKRIEATEKRLKEQHEKKKKLKQQLKSCWERKEHYKKNLEVIKSMICPIFDDVQEQLQISDDSSEESEVPPQYQPGERVLHQAPPRPPQQLHKALCAAVGCSFKGYPSLRNLCPDCYKDQFGLNVDSYEYPLM